jgi:hypothetical protein
MSLVFLISFASPAFLALRLPYFSILLGAEPKLVVLRVDKVVFCPLRVHLFVQKLPACRKNDAEENRFGNDTVQRSSRKADGNQPLHTKK